MFDKVEKNPDFAKLELKVLEKWEQNDIMKRSMEQHRGADKFTFYEGPPTANGMPHPGHVLTRVMKDVFLRYRSMRGFDVLRKAGWDTHGLPVEIAVEKELGIDGKADIEKFGVAEFIAKCRESVFKYEKEWRKMTERVGFWVDLDDPYVTCQNNYIESVWWILKRYWDEGLLYKGHKVVPQCPSCETAQSSHEIAQGYREVEDPSVFVRMRVKGSPDTSFLVWTTTPWTLISNVAIALGAGLDYAKVKYKDEYLILAEGRLPAVFGEENYEVAERYKGADLEGTEYEPLYTFCAPEKKAHYAILGDFVTIEDGTGIVHIAPAFGEDDYQVGIKFDLPFLQPVDTKGRFTSEVTPWAGLFVKDADAGIIEELRERGILYRSEGYVHTYPFCWRCHSPIVYYARHSWFIRTTAYKDTMLEVNDSINWIPEHIRKGRMGDFLENNIDWAVSRDRYWGTPLNLWICEADESHVLSVDSAADLKAHALDYPDGELDLHRPYVDAIHCKCPQCGARMSRTPEVIDCWLDSGAMPVAQWHYPHENKDVFDSLFPADFITEAIDQTRGWFYSLMAISSFLFKKSPFKSCLVLGHVLAEDGSKMSKHLGNYLDMDVVFDRFGADAFRWVFYRDNNPWLPTRFSERALEEAHKNFFLTLWNIYSFFVIYANIDEFEPAEHEVGADALDASDRWALSRLNSAVALIKENMDAFQVTPAARAIEALVDDISNWYVRRCRPRFWKSEKDDDKWAAYSTLREILVTISKLLAPFAPFTAEVIYSNLARDTKRDKAEDSVHLAAFPEPDSSLINAGLEEAMEFVRDLCNEGRSLRNKKQVKVRQPLQRIFIRLKEGKLRDGIAPLKDMLTDELNIRDIAFIDSFDDLMCVSLKPNYKKLGPKYGKDLKAIEEYFKTLEDHAGACPSYFNDGRLDVEIGGSKFEFVEGDLEQVKTPSPDYLVGETVALDMRLTPELIRAGRARELVHKIQNLRKEMDLDYAARINIAYSCGPDLNEIFGDPALAEYIMKETLAVSLDCLLQDADADAARFDIDGVACGVKLSVSN
ncbi:MAG TPA: isoleucine--tRNA ligase [bacterium]|nr:isoleucine--tRNA ligase [bacterium]